MEYEVLFPDGQRRMIRPDSIDVSDRSEPPKPNFDIPGYDVIEAIGDRGPEYIAIPAMVMSDG